MMLPWSKAEVWPKFGERIPSEPPKAFEVPQWASRLAGLLALPVVMWSGAGAFLGIAAISGGWTPPFGPTSQQ